jgi:hypothetical protein
LILRSTEQAILPDRGHISFHLAWERAIWIELSRDKVADSKFISGLDLLAKWKATEACGHNLMPEIEAAHLGEIPLSGFKRAFHVCEGERVIRDIVLPHGNDE